MFLPLLRAFLTGGSAAVPVLIVVARSQMIKVLPSPLGFEQTVSALQDGAAAAKESNSPGTRDLKDLMARHGVTFEPRVRLFGGTVARVMGLGVASEEKEITATLHRK